MGAGSPVGDAKPASSQIPRRMEFSFLEKRVESFSGIGARAVVEKQPLQSVKLRPR
jgi:hypothetical protein